MPRQTISGPEYYNIFQTVWIAALEMPEPLTEIYNYDDPEFWDISVTRLINKHLQPLELHHHYPTVLARDLETMPAEARKEPEALYDRILDTFVKRENLQAPKIERIRLVYYLLEKCAQDAARICHAADPEARTRQIKRNIDNAMIGILDDEATQSLLNQEMQKNIAEGKPVDLAQAFSLITRAIAASEPSPKMDLNLPERKDFNETIQLRHRNLLKARKARSMPCPAETPA